MKTVYRYLNNCPVCDGNLFVSELTCAACETRIAGKFAPAPISRLSAEHQQFAETFLRCRGIIREVERELGISYPTVRARLDGVVDALNAAVAESRTVPQKTVTDTIARRVEILRAVEDGELEPEEAVLRLRHLTDR